MLQAFLCSNHKIFWSLIFLSLRFFIHYEIEGQENLEGLENKGVIFASNHASYLDGPISAASMPRSSWWPKDFFPMRFLALDKYFKLINPIPFPLSVFAALYVKINGSIRVSKGSGNLRKSLSDSIDELKRGEKLWIYPEGGISKDGKLQQGKRGVIFLHKQTEASIVPVGIIGNYGILSFRTLLRKNRVKVRIGKPIYSLGDVSLEEGTNMVMQKIAELVKN